MRASTFAGIFFLAFLALASLPARNGHAAEAGLAAQAHQRAISSPLAEGAFAPTPTAISSPYLPPDAVQTLPGGSALDDYDEPAISIPDPIEPWNRFWFRFNDIFYIHVASPVYKGWTYITPQFLRTGLSNLFYNVLFPTRFINSLLQLRFFEAGVEFSRFMMNVMGSAGLGNLAADKKPIVPVDPSGEDFGQTLGRWGLGPGFYIIWPFIGPSSLRDTAGRIGDYFTDPVTYLQPWPAAWGTKAVYRLNDLGDVLPSYESLTSISIDPYIAMREAYMTMREAQIKR